MYNFQEFVKLKNLNEHVNIKQTNLKFGTYVDVTCQVVNEDI